MRAIRPLFFRALPLHADMFDAHALPIPDLGLRCLKCGYALAGLPEHRCPECGRRVNLDEHIPKGDFANVIFDAKRVPITKIVVELLQSARIPYLNGAGPANQMYGLGGATDRNSSLAVPRESYFEVIDLLRRNRDGETMPAPSGHSTEWKCRACAELNPESFETCWNCAKTRSDHA